MNRGLCLPQKIQQATDHRWYTKPVPLVSPKKGHYRGLVGGLVAIFDFPINIGFLIIPIDFHIFQRGGPTTNQLLRVTINLFDPPKNHQDPTAGRAPSRGTGHRSLAALVDVGQIAAADRGAPGRSAGWNPRSLEMAFMWDLYGFMCN